MGLTPPKIIVGSVQIPSDFFFPYAGMWGLGQIFNSVIIADVSQHVWHFVHSIQERLTYAPYLKVSQCICTHLG